MRVLVVGSGGREHALVWRLSQAASVEKLFCAPGNPGTAHLADNLALKVDDIPGLANFAQREKIDLTIVGPELPLSLGIVDEFRARNLLIFGPSKAAAQLEASKAFAKDVMRAAGVPTADYRVCKTEAELRGYLAERPAPLVLKADGLAAGKGVFVCQTAAEVQAAIPELYGKIRAERVVVEELLSGPEVSYIVATDGEQVVPCASAHDYKRIFNGQLGPNTGGMGSVSPSPYLPKEREPWVLDNIIHPVLVELRRRGVPFCGFLYAGLMIDPSGQINVLEFNARMGDPECQVIMSRFDSDLAELLSDLARSSLGASADAAKLTPRWSSEAAVCVVLSAENYPSDPVLGDLISGLAEAEQQGPCVIFQAGTKGSAAGQIVTAGGRVLGVTARGADIQEARERAYRGCRTVAFRGAHFRTDIGGERACGNAR